MWWFSAIHSNIQEFRDVRNAHLAVADSNMREFGPEPPNPVTEEEARDRPRRRPLIYEGLKFKTILHMQIWLQEYVVKQHWPYIVYKSNKNKRYVVMCEKEDCPWKVTARKTLGGWWEISS